MKKKVGGPSNDGADVRPADLSGKLGNEDDQLITQAADNVKPVQPILVDQSIYDTEALEN